MKNFKYLLPDGNDYEIKQLKGFAIVMIVLFILIAFALIFFGGFVKTGITILAVFLLAFILSKTTHKSSKKIKMVNDKPDSLVFQYTTFTKPLVFPVQDIQNFELRKIYYARILVHVELLAKTNINGKIRSISISQAMKIQPMQELLNEIEELFGTNYSTTKL